MKTSSFAFFLSSVKQHNTHLISYLRGIPVVILFNWPQATSFERYLAGGRPRFTGISSVMSRASSHLKTFCRWSAMRARLSASFSSNSHISESAVASAYSATNLMISLRAFAATVVLRSWKFFRESSEQSCKYSQGFSFTINFLPAGKAILRSFTYASSKNYVHSTHNLLPEVAAAEYARPS